MSKADITKRLAKAAQKSDLQDRPTAEYTRRSSPRPARRSSRHRPIASCGSTPIYREAHQGPSRSTKITTADGSQKPTTTPTCLAVLRDSRLGAASRSSRPRTTAAGKTAIAAAEAALKSGHELGSRSPRSTRPTPTSKEHRRRDARRLPSRQRSRGRAVNTRHLRCAAQQARGPDPRRPSATTWSMSPRRPSRRRRRAAGTKEQARRSSRAPDLARTQTAAETKINKAAASKKQWGSQTKCKARSTR